MLFIGGCNSLASIRQAHTSNNLKRPLRILLVTTSYPLQEGNSSGIFVKRLADALGRDDSLTVLTPASRATLHIAAPPTVVECFRYAPKSWQRLAHEPGGIPVALKQAPWLWLLVPAFLVSMTLSTLRHGRNADVIHANWAMPGLICGIVGKILGKPVITTLRGSDVSNLEHDVFKRSLINLVFKLNARIVTVSAPMQAMLYRLFPEYGERCLHIPNGVDSQFLALTLPTATPQKLRLISISSLIPRKNVKSIITALQGLPATVTLTVVGEGPEQAALARLTQELGLSQRVTFAGNVAPANIPNALATHDALILASHAEGRPNVVVEAMAAGRAVLASRLPGIVDLIRHNQNGLLFDPKNPASISASIRQLLQHPEKRRILGEAARQTILNLGLSWPACAQRYRDIYRQVLHKNS